jgi:hypothetical protein
MNGLAPDVSLVGKVIYEISSVSMLSIISGNHDFDFGILK